MAQPQPENLVPVYPIPQNERFETLTETFVSSYNKLPDFYVRVPGRVNLIGEHIDYCGYGVCPMALEQDILLAVAIDYATTNLTLHNANPKFKDYQCDIQTFEVKIEEGAPQWYQYFLCGVKGIYTLLPKSREPRGMKIVVSGSVPQSAGLSSSSALVSAAALMTAYAFKLPLSKATMANLCAECERYIGTQGGGMDQAIAFLATEGCAKLIQFAPLKWTDIALPRGAVFVIAHSLTNLNKAATADYNCRVVECRLAAQIIAKDQKLDWRNVRRLGDLQHILGVTLLAMISHVERLLHETAYTKDEIAELLDTVPQELNTTSLTPNTTHITSFKLKQRALHVFEEALRVEKFHETCTSAVDEEGSEEADSLDRLGKLMTQSHNSLRDLFECSHPQLDRLVEMSLSSGALGCRLTGAGWGGCAVALLTRSQVNNYVSSLKENFYRKLGVRDKFESLLFVTKPNAGACIYTDID